MASVGFDTRELDKFISDLNKTSKSIDKKSKKFLKKEATKLSKEQKQEIKSLGIGDQGFIEKEILKSSKSGKIYKYNGNLSCRAFNSHPLAHLLDKGFMHKGGKNHNGSETFVPGYHFIEKSEKKFESGYYSDIDDFINELVDDID